jgi:hypothetical protein
VHSGENTRKHMMRCTKYCYPDKPLARRAHKSEEMGAPHKMHLRIQVRAHMSTSTRKMHPGVDRTYIDSSPGAARSGVAPTHPYPGEIWFPSIGTRGVAPTPPPQLYKGASLPLSTIHQAIHIWRRRVERLQLVSLT